MAHNCLVIGNSSQCSNTNQVSARAVEATGTSAVGEQQAIISDLAATLHLDSMLTCLNAYHAVGQKANTMILVKTVGTRPEFIFAHASCQVILQSWSVVNRKRIVSNDGNIRRRVFIAQ